MNTTTLDLAADAVAEARRAASSRAIEDSGRTSAWTGAEHDSTLVLLARRRRLRRALAGQVLLVWRIAYEDACGRRIESHLVPLLVDVGRQSTPRRRAWVRRLLPEVEPPLRTLVNHAAAAWHADVVRIASAFSSVRAARERAIAAQPRVRQRLFQPGLFDRRSERARQLEMDADSDADRQARARAAAAEGAGVLSARGGELLLVIAP